MRSRSITSRLAAWSVAAILLAGSGTAAVAQQTATKPFKQGDQTGAGGGNPGGAGAFNIAVWSDNCTDEFLVEEGFAATLVTDAQLATPGFLDAYDALIVTRDGFAFGNGLSAGAAAEVQAWVGTRGRTVLFPGDWADMLQAANCVPEVEDVNVEAVFKQAVTWAAESGHGYIGEFNGTAMAVTTNLNGFNPLDLIPGDAAALAIFSDGVDTVSLTACGDGHPVTDGLTFPFSPLETAPFRTAIANTLAGTVIATFADGVPAILVGNALSLDANPESVVAGDTVTFTSCGGLPGGLLAWAVTAINGGPTFLVLTFDTFDAGGVATLSGVVPPGLAGNTVTFGTLGFTAPSTVAESNPELVTFN